MKLSRKQQQWVTFSLLCTLLFSCGWSDTGAFLAGCLTGVLLNHAIDHHSHTTIVYESSPRYERFYCHNCGHRYLIIQGTRAHSCSKCHTRYRWRP